MKFFFIYALLLSISTNVYAGNVRIHSKDNLTAYGQSTQSYDEAILDALSSAQKYLDGVIIDEKKISKRIRNKQGNSQNFEKKVVSVMKGKTVIRFELADSSSRNNRYKVTLVISSKLYDSAINFAGGLNFAQYGINSLDFSSSVPYIVQSGISTSMQNHSKYFNTNSPYVLHTNLTTLINNKQNCPTEVLGSTTFYDESCSKGDIKFTITTQLVGKENRPALLDSYVVTCRNINLSDLVHNPEQPVMLDDNCYRKVAQKFTNQKFLTE